MPPGRGLWAWRFTLICKCVVDINRSSQLHNDVNLLLSSLGPLPPPAESPVFIALSGLPGTGKSFFSRALAEKLPLAVLESDSLRKVLFPRPSYSARESARLFRAVHYIIEKLLLAGISIVLDATNLSERYRRELYRIARRTGVELIMVKVVAPAELVHERLASRARGAAGTSDADWDVYLSMKPRVEEIRRRHFVVDTSRDINPVINRIIREAGKRSENGN